jgi:hypothetical protein
MQGRAKAKAKEAKQKGVKGFPNRLQSSLNERYFLWYA